MSRARTAALTLIMAATTGCPKGDMTDQPKYKPLAASTFFDDGASARHLVPGTIAVGEELHPQRPPADLKLLQRGRQRFDISCVPCHGYSGYANGMVAQRGYPQPTSYHIERLRNAPDEYLRQVLLNGLGKMPPYQARVPASADQWAIVEYVRALQLSQAVQLNRLPPEDQRRVREEGR